MRFTSLALLAVTVVATPAGAQQPAVTPTGKARADSIAKAVRDSVALMKELGAAVADSVPRPSSPVTTGPQSGPTNPRLIPDISAVGDLIGDLSPKGSTQADKTRFGVREVEIAVQAVVDPYFRGDVFLGINDVEKISIEQAFLTTTSLPNELEAKIGRFLMPFGKQNTTHRHDLHTVEYPYVLQKLLSDDGLKGTGVWGSRVISPLGFFQEIQVTAVDRLNAPTEGLLTAEPVNKSLGGLGFSARLRNYIDLTESQNIELSFSGITGRREQPLDSTYASYVPRGVNAAAARQTIFGTDLTYRWRPLQEGLYVSFILQGEIMRQVNERNPALPAPTLFCTACASVSGVTSPYAGPDQDYTGGYAFARYQTGQRTYLGARYDQVQDPGNGGRTLRAGSGYFEWFPSEFSKLIAAYEAVSPSGSEVVHRVLLQAVFSLGPHKPHPF